MSTFYASRTRKLWGSATIALMFNGLYLVFLLLKPGSHAQFVAGADLAQLCGVLYGSLLCFSTLWGHEHSTRWNSRQWVALLLGLGILSECIGQAFFTYYDLHNISQFPNWADAGFLSEYPLLLLGILFLPTRKLTKTMQSRVLLDGLMIMVAVITFSWYFILGPNVLQGNETLFAKIVSAAYPCSDLVLMLSVLLLASKASGPAFRLPVWLLAFGLASIVICDSIYGYFTLQGTYMTGNLSDIGFPIGFMLIGLAVQVMHLNNAAAPLAFMVAPQEQETFSLKYALLPYIFMPAVLVLAFYVWHNGGTNPLALGVYQGSIVLVLLIFTRQILTIRETSLLNGSLQKANAQLEALATTDPLTGLPNHRALVGICDQELERTRRYARSCSLLFLDIDHFKALNDGYGHGAGDTVLYEFAHLVQRTLRGMDTVGRWGGEEFVAVLPEAEKVEAMAAAERVRVAVSEYVFPLGGGIRLTCSIGLVTSSDGARERDTLLKAADQAMYAAKKLGRNQVREADDPVVLTLVNERQKNGSREDMALVGTVEALCALVEARDQYTGDHTRRVASETTQLAKLLGLDEDEARMIGMAGHLHDIGKVGLPDAILQKTGSLSEEEWQMIYKHPTIGADVVSLVPSLRGIAPIIRAHHERWDGCGYPDALRGEEIPLGARIVAVVNAFEAMRTQRPYQQARDMATALIELQQHAGTQFDPHVVAAFEKMVIRAAGGRAMAKAMMY